MEAWVFVVCEAGENEVGGSGKSGSQRRRRTKSDLQVGGTFSGARKRRVSPQGAATGHTCAQPTLEVLKGPPDIHVSFHPDVMA